MTEPYHTPEYNFYPGEIWDEPDFIPGDDEDDEEPVYLDPMVSQPTENRYEQPEMNIPSVMQDAIEMITGCCPSQVFYSRDFTQALIIGDDSTWLARVSEDGSTEETYLSTQPVETLVDSNPLFDGVDRAELKGFETGFTC